MPAAGGVAVVQRGPPVSPPSQGQEEPGERRSDIDAEGRYGFDRLEPGYWFVAAFADACHLSAIQRVLIDGTTHILDFRHDYGGRLAGSVTDTRSSPLAGATVTAYSRHCAGLGPVRTGDDGGFELTGLPVGSYSLTAEHWQAMSVGRVEAQVDDERPAANVEITLVCGGTIEGRILSAKGGPVKNPGARFDLAVFREGEEATQAYIRDDGTFVACKLRTGIYAVRGHDSPAAGRSELDSGPIEVRLGETVNDIVIELPTPTDHP